MSNWTDNLPGKYDVIINYSKEQGILVEFDTVPTDEVVNTLLQIENKPGYSIRNNPYNQREYEIFAPSAVSLGAVGGIVAGMLSSESGLTVMDYT